MTILEHNICFFHLFLKMLDMPPLWVSTAYQEEYVWAVWSWIASYQSWIIRRGERPPRLFGMDWMLGLYRWWLVFHLVGAMHSFNRLYTTDSGIDTSSSRPPHPPTSDSDLSFVSSSAFLCLHIFGGRSRLATRPAAFPARFLSGIRSRHS